MNLKSCDNCGVVLDMDKFKIPDFENEDGSIDTSKCEWDHHGYVPTIDCPICQRQVRME